MPGYTFVPLPLWIAFSFVQPGGVPIWVMLQLARDTSHVPKGLEYPRGGRLERDQDPEGRSREYEMTSFQTVPCHIAGMGALSY